MCAKLRKTGTEALGLMGERKLGGRVSEGECWMVGAICGRNNRGAGSDISGRLNNEPKLQRDRHCMASFESASRWDFVEDLTLEEWRMAVESREPVLGAEGRQFESDRPDQHNS